MMNIQHTLIHKRSAHCISNNCNIKIETIIFFNILHKFEVRIYSNYLNQERDTRIEKVLSESFSIYTLLVKLL